MKSKTTGVVQRWNKEITEFEIDELRANPVEAAQVYDQRIREIAKTERRSFVEIGLICREVDKHDLWEEIVSPETGEYFHSFSAWVRSSLGFSQSSAYSAMKVLEANVPVDTLRLMGRRNAVRLARLSTKVQGEPAVIDAALTMSEPDFVAWLQQMYPDQHVEQQRMVIASPTESERDDIIDCFNAVRWVYDVENREDVLANLVAFFWEGRCEREGYSEMTNREAFEQGGRD